MKIKSIKLRFKKRNSKRIDIKTEKYKDTLIIYTYNNIVTFPYINIEQDWDDFLQLEEIAFQCYYWLTTDNDKLEDCNEKEWNEWIDKFKNKIGFRNQHVEELARNSFYTYKNFIK